MSFNTQSLQPLINFIYSVADQVLINTYEPSKYKDVILPMTVIRRLDAIAADLFAIETENLLKEIVG
jgi:type I restriction enzyme M protein